MDSHRALLLLAFLSSVRAQVMNMTVYVDPTASENSESIHLGGLFPIRKNSNGKCGELRVVGVERAEGMVYAIRTINANSSILPRVNLTFDIRDTCSVSNVALESSIEYVQNTDIFCTNVTDNSAVSGVVGASTSSISASTASFFRLFQIPQISYASTAALLSDSTVFDFFFRTIPSDVFQARAIADLIENFNWEYIFALYSDDTYGREGIESLVGKLQKQNDTRRCIALTAALPLASTDTEVYDDIMKEMSMEWVRNASVAVLFGHLEEAVAIMDAILRADNVSFLQEITWIASDSWALTLPEAYHSLARGMLGVLPHPGNVMDFRSYFDNLNPATSANPWFGQYWESVFNCSLMEPSCNDRNLSHIDTSAKVTNVIDAVYAFAYALDRMIMDYCGPNETVCDAITTTRSVGKAINGTLLREYLFNVSFPSTFSSGYDLLFDSNGDVQGSYSIINLQLTSENMSAFETVGMWDHSNLLQLTETIQWNGGSEEPPQSVCSLECEVGFEPHQVPGQEQCCWKCERCLQETVSSGEGRCFECPEKEIPNSNRSSCIKIPLTYFTWSSPWAIIMLCLTSIGIATTIFIGVMFAIFHRRTPIKASSRELSALILVGILLCYILPFLFVLKPSAAVCGVRRFAIGFCFAISYSALLVRSNRIHRIFNQRIERLSNPPRFVGSLSQIVFSSILISIQVIIAVVWLIVERPSEIGKQVGAKTVELRCEASPYFGLSVSLVYNLILLLLSTYFAFRTRYVPDNYNEAKFINITLYSLCIIWLGFVPAYFVSIRFGTVYENFFLLLGVFLSASVTLVCLLMPKVFIVFKEEKNQRSEKAVDNSAKVISNAQHTTSCNL